MPRPIWCGPPVRCRGRRSWPPCRPTASWSSQRMSEVLAGLLVRVEAPAVRVTASADQRLMRIGLWLAGGFLLLALGLPMAMLLSRAFEDQAGHFVGLANFGAYVSTPALLRSAWNSIW